MQGKHTAAGGDPHVFAALAPQLHAEEDHSPYTDTPA